MQQRDKKLTDYTEEEMRQRYRRVVRGALHFQEFAELPGPTEGLLRSNEERFRRERARVAAIRAYALDKWGETPERLAAFGWPWRGLDGYEEALADAGRYREDAVRDAVRDAARAPLRRDPAARGR